MKMAATNLLAFWHIAVILPPEISYELRPFERNETYRGAFRGASSIRVATGDEFRLRCRGDHDVIWLQKSSEDHDVLIEQDRSGQVSDLVFRTIDQRHGGTYICVNQGIFPATTVAKQSAFVSQIDVQVQSYDFKSSSPARILRHTSINTAIGDSPSNLCVDFLLPWEDMIELKLQSRNFADHFSRQLWRFPTDPQRSPGMVHYKTSLHPYTSAALVSHPGSVEISACIRVTSETELVFDLSNITIAHDQRESENQTVRIASPKDSILFKVGSSTPFGSSLNFSGERPNAKGIRLTAGSVYQFECRIRDNSTEDGGSHESYVQIIEKVESKDVSGTWCQSTWEIPAFSILGSTTTRDSNSNILVARAFPSPPQHHESNLTAPTTGSIECSHVFNKTNIDGAIESRHEILSTLRYTIMDDRKFLNEENDIVIESEIGDGNVINPAPGRPITLPQGARLVLRCLVQRCQFGQLKWMRMETHEELGYVNSKIDRPTSNRATEISAGVNANGTEETAGYEKGYTRFYAVSPLTLAFERVFPWMDVSEEGTFACLASSDGTSWRKNTIRIHVRARGASARSRSMPVTALRAMPAVPAPPLEHNTTTVDTSAESNRRVPISHRLGIQVSCTDHVRHVVVAVTVSAVVSLLLVGLCSLAMCYRLGKANLLKETSIKIKNPSSSKKPSVKVKLIGNTALAAEEEISI